MSLDFLGGLWQMLTINEPVADQDSERGVSDADTSTLTVLSWLCILVRMLLSL